MNETQQKILALISENNEITQTEIQNTLKVGRTVVTDGIKILKENNYIERIGSRKKGYWKILKK